MNFAIIPAAGSGTRFGGTTKKQFLELKGRLLLEWVLDEFVESGLFSEIVVCTTLSDVPDRLKTFGADFVEGGHTRFESIRKGFDFLAPNDEDFVFIHDAARPLVNASLIRRVVEATADQLAVVPGIPLYDTIKEVQESRVLATCDRSKLLSIQTPQGFSAAHLKKVYADARGDLSRFTDEAKALEELGINVYTVPGDPKNIKVTTPDDLKLAEFYL